MKRSGQLENKVKISVIANELTINKKSTASVVLTPIPQKKTLKHDLYYSTSYFNKSHDYKDVL
nr:hypothetical protein [Bacillus cereus]